MSDSSDNDLGRFMVIWAILDFTLAWLTYASIPEVRGIALPIYAFGWAAPTFLVAIEIDHRLFGPQNKGGKDDKENSK